MARARTTASRRTPRRIEEGDAAYPTVFGKWEENGKARQFDFIWEDGSGGLYEQGWGPNGEVVFWEVAFRGPSIVNNESAEPPLHQKGWYFTNSDGYDTIHFDPEKLTVSYTPMPLRGDE